MTIKPLFSAIRNRDLHDAERILLGALLAVLGARVHDDWKGVAS